MSSENYEHAREAEHVGVRLSIDESEFADIEDFLSHHHGIVEPKWRTTAREAGSLIMRAFASVGRSSNYTYDMWGLGSPPSTYLEERYW